MAAVSTDCAHWHWSGADRKPRLYFTGWNMGDLDMDDYYLRTLCIDFQLAVVNVEYRFVVRS